MAAGLSKSGQAGGTTAQDNGQTPAITPPSLPKGGGAIRGMGEKFAATPVTGTGSLTVPIPTSPARSGSGPELALVYDSGSGNGPFGLGWRLSLPSITRRTDRGLPEYRDADESDVFLLDAEDLIPMLDDGGNPVVDTASVPGHTVQRYRHRLESDFVRIERWTRLTDGDVHWRTLSPHNVLAIYGRDDGSRIADPADPRRVYSWLLSEIRDDLGNAVHLQYKPEDATGVDVTQHHERGRGDATSPARTANRYLKSIRYGNRRSLLDGAGQRPVDVDATVLDGAGWMFEVVFDYGEHSPTNPRPRDAGAWLCRADPFSTYRPGFEVRTYRLCQRVLMFHHFPDEAQVGQDCLVRSTDLAYRSSPIASFVDSVTQSGYIRSDGGYTSESLPPLKLEYSQAQISSQVRRLDVDSLENLPAGIDDLAYRWVDLDGEGLAGVLTQQAGAWFYKPGLGDGRLGPLQRVATRPSLADLAGGRQELVDLAGSGRLELVQLGSEPAGFFARTASDSWENFIPFVSRPNLDWEDPGLTVIDLTGDGRPDLLITEDGAFTWYASRAEAGFGPAQRRPQPLDEDRGPRLVAGDGTQSIFLADMSGDGLTDLVRIRNGDACYWPNLGYGRFGARVAMDGAPWFDRPDQFDPRRLRLADVDGSGLTDVLYVGAGEVRVWLNQAGNGFSPPQRLADLPHIDDRCVVQVADLLGNGTTCLVWSSPLPADARNPVRYVDLMGGVKPHLLVGVTNNLGAETRIHYAASTRFYLDDRRAGLPWITRLPFPVHVVERVEHLDRVSGTRLVSTYSYHHGYFDGVEREFRGFAMVEQRDTEAFQDYVLGVKHIEGTQELVSELYQPPVTTRTWFHTGAYLEGGRILHQLRDEYYQRQQHLPEPVLPAGMDEQETRECVRALKGLPLRQEVYSFDGSAQAGHPYSVVEHAYQVRRLQPRAGQRHAAFLAFGCESVTYQHEHNPSDPRIAHTLSLEVGPYGGVLKSASVVYGRQVVDPSPPAEVTRDQRRLWITYGEADHTPVIDRLSPVPAYRLPVPFESRGYEITGVTPAGALFGLAELKTRISGESGIPYEAIADGVTVQQRQLSRTAVLFRDNALAPLPPGQWDTLGRGYESYRLAFTPGVVGAYYGGRVADGDFAAAGYVHFGGDANWWIPSGVALYPANPAAHFYLPGGARDALGMETVVTLDRYDLLTERVRVAQAAWSEVTAVNDYRVLGPVMMTDPNGNRTAVEIDALGLVVKSAVMGKPGAGEGDTLADPTSRMEYDLFNWVNNGKPNFAHVFSREQHGAANPRLQESYVYANGSGGVAMVKAQVPPGKASTKDAGGGLTEVDANPRWVGTGRTILNNKGNPVKQYEPFFSTTHEYETEEALARIGVTPILFYDPVGRNVRAELPNGTLTRLSFDPWMQRVYDANDTVRESLWYADRGSPDPLTQPEPTDPEQRAAWLAAKHAGTPGVVHLDSLGRPVYAVSDFGGGTTAAIRSETDLTGRLTSLFDQLQRRVASGITGMAGTPISAETAERGARWTFVNAMGGLVLTWDEFGRELRAEYDALHRPLSAFVREAGQDEVLFNHIVYGDRHPNAAQRNLRGAAHQVFDGGGSLRVEALDFKGNPTSVERVLARDYTNVPDWHAPAGQTDYAAVQAAAAPALETAEPFTGAASYDALNRPTQVTLHGGTVVTPAYDEANRLASLMVLIEGQGPPVEFLKAQDYDARGQRLFAHHGNDVLVRYFHDPQTFRLANLVTVRSGDDPTTSSMQDLHYTYDPVGNITQCRDDSQQTRFFSNAVVRPDALYEYDALYQLVMASGREHAAAGNNSVRDDRDLDPVRQLPHVNDVNAVRTYTERYQYDPLGNLLELRHVAPVGGGSWTRHYRYVYQDSATDRTNRLAATSRPGDPDAGPYTGTYDHDHYGNMTRLRTPNPNELTWNFIDQLQRADLGGGGIAHYVYGAGGQRVRKVIERLGGARVERIYLGPLEIYRERTGAGTPSLERHTLHIADDAGGIAQVDIKVRDDLNSDPANPLGTPLIRYQYGNHLGSAILETDTAGAPISYEEYHPFGTTAYRSQKSGVDLSLKRYRFSGKERDDETGLYYFGARYYAPWLGRWTSADPAGFVSGLDLYRYCSNNPVMLHDVRGAEGRLIGARAGPETVKSLMRPEADPKEVLGYFRTHGHPELTEQQIPTWDPGKKLWVFPPGSPPAPASSEPSSSSGSGLPFPPYIRPGPSPDLPPSSAPPAPPAVPGGGIGAAPPGTDFGAAAASTRQVYRASNVMPPGTQVQHWTKELSAQATNMDTAVMNENLSPLQSRNALPATTLLVDPNGGGTTYTVSGGSTYGNEHKFADRALIPQIEDQIRAANPNADPRDVAVQAGRQARWIMTGDPGPDPTPPPAAPTLAARFSGYASTLGTGFARTFIPGFAEVEIAAVYAHPFVVGTLGIQSGALPAIAAEISAAPTTTAFAVALPALGGAVVGNVIERAVTSAGGSKELSIGAAVVGAAATGAIIGTFIPIPGVGTAVGAAIGAAIGVIGYGISKLFF